MKKIFAGLASLKKPGFTLVELLVVIAIIAILASVILATASTVINIAKRTKAQNTASQIQTATLNYYTEYSVYPTPSGVTADYALTDTDGGVTAPGNNWGPLVECLMGGFSPSAGGTITLTTFSNTRSIAFLSLKSSDVGTGTTYHKDAPLNALPWNTANPYFNIAVDTDYDGILGTGNSAVTTMPNFSSTTFSTSGYTGGGSSTAGVAVWANCSPSGSQTQANWYVHTY